MYRIHALLLAGLFALGAACSVLSVPTPQVIRETVQVEVTVEVTKLVEVTSTSEPTPTATPLAPSILTDDFEAGSGEWTLGFFGDSSSEVRDGKLLVQVSAANSINVVAHPDMDFLNLPFDLEVETARLEGPQDSYASIEFRYFDENNYAQFAINGSGLMAFGVILDGQYYDIIPWIRMREISRDKNVIRLLDYGDRVIAYANGHLLFDVPFEDLTPGSVALTVGTYAEGGAEWSFDNLSIREIQN